MLTQFQWIAHGADVCSSRDRQPCLGVGRVSRPCRETGETGKRRRSRTYVVGERGDQAVVNQLTKSKFKQYK